ncbi:DUF115 domain-containing protein [Eubacteriaceae bacterium ES3]|nr:DUF115 domain-containing protein [Eubacteriaceae bacterium ES3]
MLAENIKFLKKNNLKLFSVLKSVEEHGNVFEKVEVEEAKSKFPTIKYIEGEQVRYIHSKYNPQQEAKTIINRFEENNEINDNTYVIFFGLGLGYHVDEFVKRYPNTSFSIYEPSIEIMSEFFNNREEIKKWTNLEILSDGVSENSYQQLIRRVIINYRKNAVIIPLPIYEEIFRTEYQEFLNFFKQEFMRNRVSMNTVFAYKKRWTLNSTKNLEKILETPNITMDKFDFFKGKTAILVSAGPSLNFEIETLRKIKNEKDAVIFAVGSSVNTLVENNIFPDAVCSFDPSERNQLVYQKINEKRIKNIPMIFGSAIGYEVLDQYLGPKYHFITTQDRLGQFLLKYHDKELVKVFRDAPSVANLTIELLYVLGFSKIILVGQNLAYLDNKSYAEGIEYRKDPVDLEDSNLLETKDVEGKTVKTTRGLLGMKEVMESYIKDFDIEVINTTVGGAAIEGTRFIPLKDLELDKKDKGLASYFPVIEKKSIYDLKYLDQQIDKLLNAYKNYLENLKSLDRAIEKLQKLVKNKNLKEVDKLQIKLDTLFYKLDDNIFFILVAKPMNFTEYSILANEIELVRDKPGAITKLSFLLPKMKHFINILYADKELNEEKLQIIKAIQAKFSDE